MHAERPSPRRAGVSLRDGGARRPDGHDGNFNLSAERLALLSLEGTSECTPGLGGNAVVIGPKGTFHRQLRTVFNLGAIGDLTDGQLLERFATRGGEAAELAFAALVERHGSMVLRVCRRASGNPHDAEDAFQATFLILVKQARSLWVRDSLGPWLHRVAHRVATRARLSAARLHERERRTAAARPALEPERGEWEEIAALLHDEIERLPERYRVPVVLCDLQGVTHEKAARHLGWPVGTVKTRLARARELLRGRLSRRGLGLPGGLLVSPGAAGAVFPFRAVEVVLPGALVESTVRAGAHVAAGKALALGLISSRAGILIEEVLKSMVVTKLKLASVVVLVGTIGAAAVLAQQGPRREANYPGNRAPEGGSKESASPDRGGSGQAAAGTPAYIRQSRALIITRLEEEVAEAKARLDRTLKKFESPDHPAVVRARETHEALVQRLEKIDRILVDVVETYPTMVDFSGGPGGIDSRTERASTESAIRQYEQMREKISGRAAEVDTTDQRGRDIPAEKPQTGQSQHGGADKSQGHRAPGYNPQDSSQRDGSKSKQNNEDQPANSQKGQENGSQSGEESSQNYDPRRPTQPNSKSGKQGHGYGVVTADLDGDGVLDIVISDGDPKQGSQSAPKQAIQSGKPQARQQKSGSGEKKGYTGTQEGQSKSGSGKSDRNNEPREGQQKSDSGEKQQYNKPHEGQRDSGSGKSDRNNEPQAGQQKSDSGEKQQYNKPHEGQRDSGSGKSDRNNEPQAGQQKSASGESGEQGR